MTQGQNQSAHWPGATDRSHYSDATIDVGDRLADAAKHGAWQTVFAVLETNRGIDANRWRIGGQSFYTPLHQAAWHGAPLEVASRLLDQGAWRSLRDAEGKRPIDIARERNHHHLLDALATAEPSVRELQKYQAWDRHLDDLIRERTRPLEPISFRSVPTEVIEAEALDPLWFPYPGMYGGFSIAIYKFRVFVESWSRVVGGSGQAHVITESAATLVDEGFV